MWANADQLLRPGNFDSVNSEREWVELGGSKTFFAVYQLMMQFYRSLNSGSFCGG